MRRALLPALLLLTACTGGGTPDHDRGPGPVPPQPLTADALLAVAEDHLGVPAEDPETGRIRPPECPGSYRRLWARASFGGGDIGLEVVTGECDLRGFRCHRDGDRGGEPLRGCRTRRLAGGRLLVAGRHDVYQESSSWIVAVTGGGREIRVAAPREGPWSLDDLVDLAADPAYGPPGEG